MGQVRLTPEGIYLWSKTNIPCDPRQVFSVEYECNEHLYILAWWGERKIIEPQYTIRVEWSEEIGDYI